MLQIRKAYESKLDVQLARWAADLHVMKAQAARAEVDAKANYDQAIDAMQQKHDDARMHLRALKAATDEAWENVKTGTEKVWCEVKALFESSMK